MPSAAGKPVPAQRPTSPPAAREPGSTGPVSPEVAIRHFQELLRAKQERIKQGPNYPPANPYTGRHQDDAAPAESGEDSHGPPAKTPDDSDDLLSSNGMHGRGNQGMRKQK